MHPPYAVSILAPRCDVVNIPGGGFGSSLCGRGRIVRRKGNLFRHFHVMPSLCNTQAKMHLS